MSEQCDENLLDEDLGDEEYELGNDEEEALLADDYEVETQSSYKGEEETDDVLDLGVTDALDDLEGEEDNVNYSGVTDSRNHNNYYEERHDSDVIYYTHREYEENIGGGGGGGGDGVDNMGNSPNKPDLREKLQKSAQKDFYVGNGQGMEDDDCEEAKERRNRFQNERTIISPKMNHEIPDSLENVVTLEQSRPAFRGRGRGRGIRGIRGGRFIVPNFTLRFNGPRGPPPFENQRPPFRPPLLENRPPYPPGPRLNMPNQQIPFQQNNPQMVPPYAQFQLSGPPQIRPQFMENRPPFNPNQFQGLVGPPGPRLMGPRPDFDPRGALLGPAPPQNYPQNQAQFMHNQAQHFQNQGQQINQGPQGPGGPQGPQGPPPMQGNQVPLVQGNQGPPMQGNQRPPQMQGNQGPPLLRNPGPLMQGHLRPPIHNQIPVMQSHPNAQNIQNQVPFDNLPPYQDPHFCQEARPVYDSRPVYNEQTQNNQYNNGPPPPASQPTGNVPNPLPPGHKILINPHFRGAVQPTTDARLVWDSAIQQQQPPPPPSQIGNEQFIQPPGQFPDQRPYSQPPAPAPAQPQQEYPQPNVQQNKSDDPYAYFSDVWQENKTQKTPNTNSTNSFNNDTNYNRDNYYNEFDNNYKSQNQWNSRDNYQGGREQQSSYRDREPHSRSNIERPRDSRVPSSNSSYRNDSYDQNRQQRIPASRPPATPSRGIIRSQQKRSPEGFASRGQRDTSPKRVKLNSRNLHEVRTIDTLSDAGSEKKVYENEDPEMREYRKKLDEQKRMREKFLREKENRRKIAAMEKQYDKDKGETNVAAGEPSQETKPVSVVTGVTKDVKSRPAVGRGRSRPVGPQPTEGLERSSGLRIVRTIQTVQPIVVTNSEQKDCATSSIPTIQQNETIHKRQLPPSSSSSSSSSSVAAAAISSSAQHGIRRVVIHKPLPNTQKVATTIQKTVSNLQKGMGGNVQQKILQKIVANQPGGVQKIVAKKNTGGNVQMSVSNAQKNLNPHNQKVVVNTQNNQRVVLQKSLPQMRKLPDIKTNTVKIENLAASTTENQIRRMCQGIGTLESIRMSEGSATIVFKTQSAAFVFHKKYQRKMLDLSLITVHLVPQTGGNKAIPTVVKKS